MTDLTLTLRIDICFACLLKPLDSIFCATLYFCMRYYISNLFRPWNSKHSRPRDNGLYYEKFWAHAVFAKPQIVSITSFNEWHEGSQIEPAMSRESNSVQRFKSKGFKYEVYDKGPNQYLKLTRKWVTEFQNRTSNSSAKYASPL